MSHLRDEVKWLFVTKFHNLPKTPDASFVIDF